MGSQDALSDFGQLYARRFGFGLPGPVSDEKVDSELNHGKLAMLGMLGMMAQELVTHQPLF